MTVTGRRESFARLCGDWRQGQAGRQVWENRRDSHGGVSFWAGHGWIQGNNEFDFRAATAIECQHWKRFLFVATKCVAFETGNAYMILRQPERYDETVCFDFHTS